VWVCFFLAWELYQKENLIISHLITNHSVEKGSVAHQFGNELCVVGNENLCNKLQRTLFNAI
jgi:hypothetical protein